MSKELVECLIDIIVINDVARFIDILKRFKRLIDSQEDASFNSFEELNTDASNILNDLKLLCNPPEYFLKYIIEKHFWDKSKQQKGELTDAVADDLEKKTWNTVQTQKEFQADLIPEKPLKKDYYDIQKLQTYPADDCYTHTVEKRPLKLIRCLSFPGNFFNDSWEKRGLKQERSLSNEFLNNSTDVKTVDTSEQLVHHSDVFLETGIKKPSLLNPIGSSYIYPKIIGQKLTEIFKISGLQCVKYLEAFSSLCQSQFQKVDLKKQLEKITEATENVITSSTEYLPFVCSPECDQDVLKILNNGKCITNYAGYDKAEDILQLIYRIGSGHSDFSKLHKLILGTLIISAMDFIEIYILHAFCSYELKSYSSIVRKKTSLEIILRDYLIYSFPLKKSKLVECRKLKECIRILNSANKEYCEYSDGNEDSEEYEDSEDCES